MRTEPPTPPWDQYRCDTCDRPANSLYTHKADDGETDIQELHCWEHAGWADDLGRHRDRAGEIERMKAEGRDPGCRRRLRPVVHQAGQCRSSGGAMISPEAVAAVLGPPRYWHGYRSAWVSPESARIAWEGLSSEDQARLCSYWQGAPFVQRARDLLVDFAVEQGWHSSLLNAVGRYRSPEWDNRGGRRPAPGRAAWRADAERALTLPTLHWSKNVDVKSRRPAPDPLTAAPTPTCDVPEGA
jgi:hypothetical protein